MAEDSYNISKTFPKEFFQNTEDYIPILRQIEIFEKDPNLVVTVLNVEGSEIKQANMDEIFSIFLLKISKHLKPQYFKEIALFICLYRKALVELSQKEKEENEESLDSKNLNAELIIIKSNQFILEFLPKLFSEFHLDNLLFFGQGADKINNAILFTQHFGNWLYSCHFTDSKLEMNYGDMERK